MPSPSWRRLTSASYNCSPLCPGRAARGRKCVPRRNAARRTYLNVAALPALPGGFVIGSRNAAAPESSRPLSSVLPRGRAGEENQQLSIVASLCAARRARDFRSFSSLSSPPPAGRTQQACSALPSGCPGGVLIVPAARARAAAHTTQLNKSLASRPRALAQTIVDISPFLPGRGRGELREVHLGSPAEPGTQHSTNFLFLGRPRTHCLTSSASRPRAGERQSHHRLSCGLRAGASPRGTQFAVAGPPAAGSRRGN